MDVFTDGSALRNGQANARAGWAAVFPQNSELDASGVVPGALQTNNRAEMLAIIEALERSQTELHVYTDSMLMINTITKWMAGWKRKGWLKADGKPCANQDLLVRLDEALDGRNVHFHHVRAHTGKDSYEARWNAEADARAQMAAAQR